LDRFGLMPVGKGVKVVGGLPSVVGVVIGGSGT
jgi:hypothetical protein